MANNNATTNLKLILPVEENINWAGTINENFKTIDDAVGEIETKYTTLINRNIDNAAIFIDDKVTAVNFANKPDINKLILGNITASGFALADNNNEIPSDQYVNFTKGRCFYVYCGPGDNAFYKGDINNTPPYNMDWANGDIMVFDKEYRDGQYQVSFRKMPQVLGKKYLNQSTKAICLDSKWEPSDNFKYMVLDGIDGPDGKVPGYADKNNNYISTFPNIECNFFYYNPENVSGSPYMEGQPWEKVQLDYRITKEPKGKITLWVKTDDSYSWNGYIWAVINYRNE